MGADGTGAVARSSRGLVAASAARTGVTRSQMLVVSGLAAAAIAALLSAPAFTLALVVAVLQVGFVVTSLWRFALAVASLPPIPQAPPLPIWPRYTVLARFMTRRRSPRS
jgi:hypothetical protein